MFIYDVYLWSSISSGLEFWSENHTSVYENPELHFFKNIIFFGEISLTWPNYLLGTNVKTLESCW